MLINDCYYGGGVIRVFIKVKYLPLAITWDSSDINNGCHDGDFLRRMHIKKLYIINGL